MDLNRREFLKISAIFGASAFSASTFLAACSNDEARFDLDKLSLARVSSDIYQTELSQRFAFTIFEERNVVAGENINVTIIDPAGVEKEFKEIKVRDTGIKDLGIYSLEHSFATAGIWRSVTTFAGKELTLDFQVAQAPTAPGLGQVIPTESSPTKSNPQDAQILCTAFEGQCELHDHDVAELSITNKPYVVLFATPARCETAYCGPVLDLTRNVAKNFDIPTTHIEIYQDETSPNTLDIVKTWNLPSEPWMFGVDSSNKVVKRLDGAFDESEITELYESLA